MYLIAISDVCVVESEYMALDRIVPYVDGDACMDYMQYAEKMVRFAQTGEAVQPKVKDFGCEMKNTIGDS
ncbi:hypothetical protein P3T76_015967 [Phytophthora citrophthora]|uniref:Uncharacterized protein n=1 Tax=Phytophthora citrophthora TaxID=4793 RepID=A0AAD9L9T3_9STRA|nr:hypothetical protein P3T76_015967 [Phytophthora citrophthora]